MGFCVIILLLGSSSVFDIQEEGQSFHEIDYVGCILPFYSTPPGMFHGGRWFLFGLLCFGFFFYSLPFHSCSFLRHFTLKLHSLSNHHHLVLQWVSDQDWRF